MAKTQPIIISDNTKDAVRFITMKTQYADTQINICKDLNLVVINKTFHASGFKHHAELSIEEFRELQKLMV